VDNVTSTRRREIEQIVAGITAEDRDIFIRVLNRFAQAAGEVPEQDWATGWVI
jgi:DNA-binding MarR family transcriptional regulator